MELFSKLTLRSPKINRLALIQGMIISTTEAPPDVICKKLVLENLAKLTGKQLYLNLFVNNVVGLSLQLYYKRDSGTSVFLIIVCYVMLCFVVLCYAMLCCVMLCYVVLCYIMLCYVMLCYITLCHVLLCYVM